MRIQTTVVGSYPIPRWLYGDASKDTLRDAISVVMATQERAGIDLVADGELNRFDPSHPETNGMIDYFVSRMSGVQTRYSVSDIDAFRADQGMSFRSDPAGIVTGEIGEGVLNLPADYEFTRPLTAKPLKFTCTGPHMLAKTVTDRHYGSYDKVCMAIAEVLRKQLARIPADVVQIDEANISGHPEDSKWAAAALNHVFDGIKSTRGCHVCFGNYGGQSIQRGGWDQLLSYLNALHADHVLLENAHRRPEELSVFRELRPDLGLGLGVVDIKRTEIESADDIANSIERAEAALGEGRIRYINPDCGFWMLKRSIADGKIRALVQGRDLYEGRIESA